MEILKFRAFSSNCTEGFIIIKKGPLPEIVLEDILFQLFEPFFPKICCPEIYFFTSTDEILKIDQLSKAKDYIYVHFLQRVDTYLRQGKLSSKLKISSIEGMSKGIQFEGTNLYIFSQKQYLMYGKKVFRQALQKRIKEINLKQERKVIKYTEFIRELQQLKDNFQMMKLKEEIRETVQTYREKVTQLQLANSRYLRINSIMSTVLKNSGIGIQNIGDLK